MTLVVLLMSISYIGPGPIYPYSVLLSFMASTSTNIAGYNMYRASFGNNVCSTFSKLNTALITETIYTDENPPQGLYCYEVTALDTNGNESVPSNIVESVNIPPPPPTNLAVTNGSNGDPKFTWTQSTGTALVSNKLWCGLTTGGPYTLWESMLPKTSILFYADPHWYKRTPGTTYCVITATSSTNGTSGYSNEVTTTF